jgi:hypothetical protein
VAVALLHFHFNLVCDCGCVGRCTDRICAVNAGDSYGSHNLEQSKELEGVESRKQTIVVLEPHEA